MCDLLTDFTTVHSSCKKT